MSRISRQSSSRFFSNPGSGAALIALLCAFFLPSAGFGQGPGKQNFSRRTTGYDFIGLEHITPRDLESSIPFVPGDFWRDEFLTVAKQSITEYFAKRGFYEAKVEVHSNKVSDSQIRMVVKVEEGRPCIIKSFWIDDPPAFKSKHVMLRFKSKMADVVRMHPGDRYDEQLLSDRVRELRDWLVDEDFILANTDKVKLSFNDDRTEVSVVLAVDYGERVTFGFQGATVFSNTELNELIAQVRATGLGKDYVGVIQRRFLDEYKSKAYDNTKIDLHFGEGPLSKHVTFAIHEGVRTELQELKWEGLSEQNIDRAREVFQNGSARLVQRGYFVEKDVDKAILLVLEDLKAQGYLSSKLITKSVHVVKAPAGVQRVRVLVQIAEGEQTLVGKIDIQGFRYFDAEKITTTLGVAEGKPFNPFSLEEGLQRVRALYMGEGFLDFHYLTKEDDIVTFSENNRTANIHLSVHEGSRVKIGKIEIKGLQLTKEYVVRRELMVNPGDWWLGTNVLGTETNIRKLGLFSEVRITPSASEQGPGYRDMTIDLKEADPGVIEAGPGFRSDLGIRAFSRVSYNNIFGRNWIGSLGAEVNRRVNNDYRFLEYKFDSTFVEPRFFGTRNLYTIGASLKKERFPPDFNAVTTQFLTGFERKFSSIISGKISYKLERIRQFDVFFQNQFSDRDNRSMLIGSIVPSLTLDSRDNPFTTTTGWLMTAQLEYAHPHLSNQSVDDSTAPGYHKWTASIHKYTPLTKDIVWSSVASGGFARSDIAGREIPLIKLFRLGGYSTIRGFPEDAINVDTIRIEGTLTFLNFRTQIDLPLVGDLKFAPFLDAGNLYIDQLRNNPFLRAGAGAGLHYMTPIGPINLDWGHKVNPVGGEAPNQIHFSVGLI